MVKLCVGFGQEHPEGVLQLSDTETVLAFWCNSNMIATLHHLAASMVWCGNAIKLHIKSLMSMQVRDYIAARSSHFSGAWMPVIGMG